MLHYVCYAIDAKTTVKYSNHIHEKRCFDLPQDRKLPSQEPSSPQIQLRDRSSDSEPLRDR